MGKLKVAQKNTEDAVAAPPAKSGGKTGGARQRVSEGRIYIKATYNNTLMTVTDTAGRVIAWMSAGSMGFSGPKKATPFAASKVAEAVVQKIEKTGPTSVEVYVRGVGSGRDSALRSLAARGMNITAVRDVTPIPHNGPKPPKTRRV